MALIANRVISNVAKKRVCGPKKINSAIPNGREARVPIVPGAFGERPLYPTVIKNKRKFTTIP
jgi:hypothetical protein